MFAGLELTVSRRCGRSSSSSSATAYRRPFGENRWRNWFAGCDKVSGEDAALRNMKHLVIRDPWTMPYFEYEQQFIDELKREIGPDHPLYRKRLYVTAVRRDPTAVIFETVAEKSIYALVYLTYSGKRGKRNPKTRIIPSREDLQAFIQKEHDDWIEQCKRKGCYDTLKPLSTKSPED